MTSIRNMVNGSVFLILLRLIMDIFSIILVSCIKLSPSGQNSIIRFVRSMASGVLFASYIGRIVPFFTNTGSFQSGAAKLLSTCPPRYFLRSDNRSTLRLDLEGKCGFSHHFPLHLQLYFYKLVQLKYCSKQNWYCIVLLYAYASSGYSKNIARTIGSPVSSFPVSIFDAETAVV